MRDGPVDMEAAKAQQQQEEQGVMTPEREAELFVKQDMLIDAVRRQEDRMIRMESTINSVGDRVSRVEGRIEEQSRMLQIALAGRISRPKNAAE